MEFVNLVQTIRDNTMDEVAKKFKENVDIVDIKNEL